MTAPYNDCDSAREGRCTCKRWQNVGSSPAALMIGVLFIIASLLEWARGHLGPGAVAGVVSLVVGITFLRWLVPRYLRRLKTEAPAQPAAPAAAVLDDGELTYGTATSAVVRQMDLSGLRIVLAASCAQADRTLMLRHEAGPDRGAFVVSPHAADAAAVHALLRRSHEGDHALQETAAEILQRWQEAYDSANVLVGCWQASTRTLAYFSVGFETPSIINRGWPHRSQAPIQTDARQAMTFGVHHLTGNERWLLFTRPLVDVADPQHQPFNEVGLVQYAHDAVAMEPTVWVRYLLQQALVAHHGTLPAGAVLVSLMRSRAAAAARRPLKRVAVNVPDDEEG
ncbi:MAG: hypothetical protein LLG01_15350 [Planctomycetaceae bacterium]|nr:hypothetical protein [Planctomycetaceae bacterium]